MKYSEQSYHGMTSICGTLQQPQPPSTARTADLYANSALAHEVLPTRIHNEQVSDMPLMGHEAQMNLESFLADDD